MVGSVSDSADDGLGWEEMGIRVQDGKKNALFISAGIGTLWYW